MEGRAEEQPLKSSEDPMTAGPGSVWDRVREHKVIQWGVAYLGAALALAQGIQLAADAFQWSDTVGRVAMLALIAGLPIALTVAWYQGHRGLKRVSAGELAIISVLILIGAAIFTLALRPSSDAVTAAPSASTAAPPASPEAEYAAQASRPPNSIAVIPFVNNSSDEEQAYFADGLSEEIMNQLAQVRALRVTARTSSFAFKGTTEPVDKIAAQLNVAHVLEGSVRKAGDRLVITVQLVEPMSGFQLWSSAYNRELKDVFAIQQDIARQVVKALQVTLGLNEDQRMAGLTENLDAYSLYLASTARDRGSIPAAAQSLELIDQALAIDPNFALAWAQKARLTLFLRLDPQRNGAELQAAAEQAARRAVELAPDSAVAHAVLANAASVRGDWPQAEATYREAFARGEPAERGGGYGLMSLVVGHVYQARERLLQQRQLDPLNDSAVAFLAAAEDSLGNPQGARAEYERGAALFRPWYAGYYNVALTRAGLEGPLWPEQPVAVGFSFANPPFAAIVQSWDDRAAALEAVRGAYAAIDESVLPLWRVLVRLQIGALAARFGDPELALTAFEETFASGPEQIYAIWRPVYRDMRKLPRFKEFVRRIGLVDYWREYGWADFCRPIGENDFECD
jgi:TolB-like protein/Tfp pilus assembly protein PilF